MSDLFRYRMGLRKPSVCTENLNTGVVVMKSAQDGARELITPVR